MNTAKPAAEARIAELSRQLEQSADQIACQHQHLQEVAARIPQWVVPHWVELIEDLRAKLATPEARIEELEVYVRELNEQRIALKTWIAKLQRQDQGVKKSGREGASSRP